MTITQIEQNIKNIIGNFSQDDFIFDLLLAYGEPKATISRLRKGDLNQLESKGELTHRKKLFFKVATDHLHSTVDKLRNDSATLKQKPRFIIVTDYKTLLAYDTKTTDTLDIELTDLTKHYDFFLPWAGMEKSTHQAENPADVKASEKMAKLYDEILKDNHIESEEDVHALNVFLTRLLFCYFAEDSDIFTDNIFTHSISSHTQANGSDVGTYLDRLFDVFNTDEKDRDASLPEYLKAFPYVNGGLFRDKFTIPTFTMKSRNILLEIGSLNWSEINPDIFGSMIQAVVKDEYRGDMGMHYTSVPNIMKVMQPLFLDELYEEFEKAKGNTKKLNLLHLRLQNLKIFDPACGSGNFLIIAYKELRTLEMLIFKEGGLLISPSIKLTQFYGIELDDFAHEVAILSLWLAEHQMNMLFKKEFGTVPPALPLQDGGNIVQGNATRLDWEEVCPKVDGDEIYILGNPPYLGSSMQNKEQKADKEFVFDGLNNFKNLDYIACWFLKGAKYIQKSNAQLAFVSTNSVSQGEQVSMLWPNIFKKNIEIFFAYQSFKWTNNAKGNAGVSVVVIGLRNISKELKFLFINTIKHEVKNINAYLVNSNNIIIEKKQSSISFLPSMVSGNKPVDGGNLILSEEDKNKLLEKEPNANKFLKKLLGASELMSGQNRYCLWINDSDLEEAQQFKFIRDRIESNRQFRLASRDSGANNLANSAHQFRDFFSTRRTSIVIPQTGSERRKYLPIGFINSDTIVSNAVRIIYDAEIWIMGLLSSNLHILWVRAVAGRMKMDMQYSNTLCYNTFPFPNINKKQKEEITELVLNIRDEREQHTEKTLAQMYDPDKMPQGLKEAHHQLDLAIEKCYRNKPFENDEERLEYLFKLYEEMTVSENK
ncbi:class I SAM-dependent DNA methyltransferase [Candidatus Sulfurimonas marisnigri]|uniref:site-specific DNA-methyltransferase (adenine-specific) n=1 Tax=Candidatus Sulfurimonas marisnigri TaxID=2740405 RepID=A0A7S7M2A2_9BACT|nr:DNA methyltransferase [Candidatus Sulfurimonas marisnigri]QOY55703.1 class I SAM-dependent DNA methyltransferase [Candidatus Sulfurimonas marisnigri]